MHAPETLPTEVAGVARNKPTMLVVDDEDGPRQSLKVLFKDDFNVLLADDGPTGIKFAQEHPIDVAVLDIRMAGMSGLEVLERLKFVDPGIEVVMMTAFETPETLHQALRLRACDYVNKPFDVNTMRKAVGMALDRRSLASAPTFRGPHATISRHGDGPGTAGPRLARLPVGAGSEGPRPIQVSGDSLRSAVGVREGGRDGDHRPTGLNPRVRRRSQRPDRF